MTLQAAFGQKATASVEPARMVNGARMILRGLQRLLGVSLTLAAILLWIAPGSSWESDILLFKLILTLTAVLAGIGFMSASIRPDAPEIEIDVVRREVRLVRHSRGFAPVVLKTCSFAGLSRAEQSGPIVRLWDRGGVFLAEVSLTDKNVLRTLVHGLRDEGKLA